MRNKKNIFYWLILGAIVVAGLYYWFSVQEKPLPERDFLTSQLLLSPLPGWGIYSSPEDPPVRDFFLDKAVAGSEIRLMKPPTGIGKWFPADVDNQLWEPIVEINQRVVKFFTIGYARQAYSDHNMVLNGRDTPLFTPLQGLEYKSPTADQFRILCDSSLPQKGGTDCFLDAQYQEFYIEIQYSSANPDNIKNTNGDLKTIATEVDAQMEKYLGLHK